VRRIVSDTGPVLHLTEAGSLRLLSLAGEVHVPSAVDGEMVVLRSDWEHERPGWIVVDAVAAPYSEHGAEWQEAGLLGAGESQAIALAQEIEADWLLTDDAAARLFAEVLGLEVHGSLGIVLWAAAAGHLERSAAEAALDLLARSSLWVSAAVLTEARLALSELLRET